MNFFKNKTILITGGTGIIKGAKNSIKVQTRKIIIFQEMNLNNWNGRNLIINLKFFRDVRILDLKLQCKCRYCNTLCSIKQVPAANIIYGVLKPYNWQKTLLGFIKI